MVDLTMQAVQPVRLTPESRFRSRCHPGVPCFTDCCDKTTIIITPYDILRLKERLGITSGEFLERYTRREEHDKSGLPMVVMDMPRYGGVCPFVLPVTGCQVYSDRPATCRYYPVGQGMLITEEGLDEFYFLVKEPHCKATEGADRPLPGTMGQEAYPEADLAGRGAEECIHSSGSHQG